eukprot:comp16873_c0_seq1/m.15361 comp16873_c0_seq1/g.15361  ORF comp16873_c0_seq1/g.15361 comp16873_c0_seq1/m.15361 type:complete len:174 (-) comp16873_c0_seq1:81-602(-)
MNVPPQTWADLCALDTLTPAVRDDLIQRTAEGLAGVQQPRMEGEGCGVGAEALAVVVAETVRCGLNDEEIEQQLSLRGHQWATDLTRILSAHKPALISCATHPPAIPMLTDVSWSLDYTVRSRPIARQQAAEYTVTMATTNGNVAFACTVEELQDLVNICKEALNSAQRHAAL